MRGTAAAALRRQHTLDGSPQPHGIQSNTPSHPPVATCSLQRDLCLLPSCVGVGEVAVADHRGSAPTSQASVGAPGVGAWEGGWPPLSRVLWRRSGAQFASSHDMLADPLS